MEFFHVLGHQSNFFHLEILSCNALGELIKTQQYIRIMFFLMFVVVFQMCHIIQKL